MFSPGMMLALRCTNTGMCKAEKERSMLLVYFVSYFVGIVVGLVLPFCIASMWFLGKTYDLGDIGDIAMGVAIISWVLAFRDWGKDSPGEDN